jgi:hypothetical protein
MSTRKRLEAWTAVFLAIVFGTFFGISSAAQADTSIGHFDVYSSVTGGHGWGSSIVWNDASGHILLNGGAIKDNACDNYGSEMDIAAGSNEYLFRNATGCGTADYIPDGTTIGYTTYTYIRIRVCLYSSSQDYFDCGGWFSVYRGS